MSALLVLVGLAFGPSGLGVLTPVLTFLDPIVPVAFAVLGVLVAVYASPARKLVMIAIVAAITDCQIPAQEQILSTGAAAQNMLNAAHALGLGAMWISPMIGEDEQARTALGLDPAETLIGWLCMGTLKAAPRPKKRPGGARFARLWLEAGVTTPFPGGEPAPRLKAAE